MYLNKRYLASAFTYAELMVVIVIMAIAGTMVMGNYSSVNSTILRDAAKTLVADIEYAQVQSMAHGDDTRVLVFDTVNNLYRLAANSDQSTPLTNPVGKTPYQETFGAGRLSHLKGVQLSSVDLNGDSVLGFSVLGNIDQASDAKITLSKGSMSIDITINASTGMTSISDLY